VKVALFKASFIHCLANQVRWMVIGARSPALVRTYRSLNFHVLLHGEALPLSYAGGLPHWVLGFNVQTAERTWKGANNALYAFMVETFHPDLVVAPRPYARIGNSAVRAA